MGWLNDLFWPLFSAAVFVGCLYWAGRFVQETRLHERLNLGALGRLFAVLALGGLVYSPVYRAVSGIVNVLRAYSAWSRAGEFVGSVLILAFLAWLFTRPDWRK